MTVTLITLVVVLILALLIVPFTRQIVLDKEELSKTPINEKFKILADIVNEKLFDGRGELTLLDDDPRQMNIFCKEQANYLIKFYYSTGNLTIILNYKYFHNELKYEELYSGLRNLSAFMQKDIAYSFLEVCHKKVLEHQQKVSQSDVNSKRGATYSSAESDPTDILSSVYHGFTTSQKKSVINLMYYITLASDKSEEIVSSLTVMNQYLLILNLDLSLCKQQFQKYGIDKIITDLKDIDEGVMTSIVLGCLQLLSEVASPNENPIMQLPGQRFFDVFNQLGYSEERLSNMIQKIMLLQKND